MEQVPKKPTATEIDEAVSSAEKQVEKFLFEEEEGRKPRFKKARERKIRESFEKIERQMSVPASKSSDVTPPTSKVNLSYLSPLEEIIDWAKSASLKKGETKKDLDELIKEWGRNNVNYEFQNINIFSETEINYAEGAPNLTPQFIDNLISIAKKQTKVRHLFKDIREIKVYGGERQIGLRLKDSGGKTTRLYFRSKPPFDLIRLEH